MEMHTTLVIGDMVTLTFLIRLCLSGFAADQLFTLSFKLPRNTFPFNSTPPWVVGVRGSDTITYHFILITLLEKVRTGKQDRNQRERNKPNTPNTR